MKNNGKSGKKIKNEQLEKKVIRKTGKEVKKKY